MDVVPALSLDAIPYPLDEQSLRDEVKSLTAAIDEANEERAQAAEYGLVLLSEKQALRSQYDELSGLYESTKRELENSVDVSSCCTLILEHCISFFTSGCAP